MNKTYAGIGSRETPIIIKSQMSRCSAKLEKLGYCLYSGGAEGADTAFASGIVNRVVYLPWVGFGLTEGMVCASDEAMELASYYHPNWDGLSQGGKKLMARNCHQILGEFLDSPVDFVLCWTPDGAETKTTSKTGGTGQAIRIAIDNKISVFNLKNEDTLVRLKTFLDK